MWKWWSPDIASIAFRNASGQSPSTLYYLRTEMKESMPRQLPAHGPKPQTSRHVAELDQ